MNMNFGALLQRMTMRRKLVASLLAACLIPLIAIGLIGSQTARSAIHKQAFNQLESLRDVKKRQIEDYFEQIRSQVITFSENGMIVDAMLRFQADFGALYSELQPTVDELTVYRDAVERYYTDEFGREFADRTGSSTDIQRLLPSSPAAIIAQHQYIAANPHPLGSKEALDSANDASAYRRTHAQYHPRIRNYLQKFEYYDIFLIDPDTGDIVYSVFKELDYATSLLTGPYSDTNFASVFKEARTLEPGDSVALIDFAAYLPSYQAAASFIASPIYDGDSVIGVLVFQMPVGKINAIMQERSGMGESGETYLIGGDKLMRSQSRFVEDNTILTTAVDTAAAQALIKGRTGSEIVDDYRGVPVLSSFAPLEIEGLSWGILAEIDEAEAFAAVGKLTTTTLVCVFAGSLLAMALAFLLSRSVGRQLGADPARLQEVVEAIANDDLTMDLSEDGPSSGVYDGIRTMQRNLRDRISADRDALRENGRIREALNTVDGNVMITDPTNRIIYLNSAMQSLMRSAESDFRKALPEFDADGVMGMDISGFYSGSDDRLHDLRASATCNMVLGGRTIRSVMNPVIDNQGDRLGTVVEWTDRTQEVAIEKEVAQVVDAALEGNLNERIELTGKDGFFATLSQGVNQLVTVSEQVIDDTLRVLSAMASGDLQQKIEGDYQGSFDRLKRDANATVDKLTQVVCNIKSSAGAVKTAADEISHGNTDLSQRTEQQASSLGTTASSMDEMTTTVRQNADNAVQANQLAKAAREQAERGGIVVNQAVSAMEEINGSSRKISDIIGVIDEIAFQTNLLALNASVEAARAGEQGRGFAVVASEVRNLAGRSATAAKEIKELIVDSAQKVEEGSRLVDESGQTLQEIVSGVKKVTDIVGEIAAASQEQSTDIDEVNKAIARMDELTQQNAALVEEAAAASESMGSQADDLNTMMTFFSVDDSGVGLSASSSSTPQTIPAPDRRAADRPWGEGAAVGPQAQTTQAAAVASGTPTISEAQSDTEWAEF